MILVGEMRDLETIGTALHAAETGHMVFSTLHTLDAVETSQPHHFCIPAARAKTDSHAAGGRAAGDCQPKISPALRR